MSCNPVTNIISLEFSNDDSLNWNYQSLNQIHNVNGRLFFNPENANIVYKRNLGNVSNKDRLRLRFYINNDVTQTGQNQSIYFRLKTYANIIYEEIIYLSIENGKNEKYIDRVIEIDNVNDDVFFEMNLQNHYEYGVYLKYLILDEFDYCIENLRNYFILDKTDNEKILNLFQTARIAKIKLNSIKIDNIETLTNQFHIDNDNQTSIPLNEWYFAKSDDDGKNRQSSIVPTLFNPFIKQFGLTFDNSNYYSGLPNATTNGNDYGQGIMKIGTELPKIKDVSQNNYIGVFFIDIDFTKNYYCEFELIVNNQTNQLYDNPAINRKYIIKYDKTNCEWQYYFVENGQNFDMMISGKEKGFLKGETGNLHFENKLPCNFIINSQGRSENIEKQIEINGKGWVEIEYKFFDEPNRLILSGNGNIFDTKYKGKSTFNNDLLQLGISQNDIATSNPSNGHGYLRFYFDSITPKLYDLKLFNPLKQNNDWYLNGFCAREVVWEIVENPTNYCQPTSDAWFRVYFQNPNEIDFMPNVGDIIYRDNLLNLTYYGHNVWHNLKKTYKNTQIINHRFKVDQSGKIIQIDCN